MERSGLNHQTPVIELHIVGNLDGAKRGYRSVISTDPGDDLARGNLALICVVFGRIHECIELLNSALQTQSG